MRAIVITEPGGPEVLRWQEVPDATPAAGEVLIDVVASAVNRADVMQRLGHYPPPPGAPEYPGLECSGRILELGEGVTGWRIGDEVCALLAGGGYAERVAVPAGHVLPVPDGVSLLTAAALPEVVCTVWSNLFMLANLRPGESALIHGGAGGIGTVAVQLAHLAGARVFATAGSPRKLALCRKLGADVVIDYHEEDFAARVAEETGGRGVDVILDNMGAAYLDRNVRALATSGRLVVIGLQGGRRAELDLGALLAKRAAVLATTLRARTATEKATIVAAVREHVWPLLAAGGLEVVVEHTVPVAEAARAHELMDDQDHVGKIVLDVQAGHG
jgi:putative PIG3 family NAD(P)H quinone oxidoreductase